MNISKRQQALYGKMSLSIRQMKTLKRKSDAVTQEYGSSGSWDRIMMKTATFITVTNGILYQEFSESATLIQT